MSGPRRGHDDASANCTASDPLLVWELGRFASLPAPACAIALMVYFPVRTGRAATPTHRPHWQPSPGLLCSVCATTGSLERTMGRRAHSVPTKHVEPNRHNGRGVI
jgi:hypothetical protein